MKIDKLLLEQIVKEETQKVLSEANPFVNMAANFAQAISGRSGGSGYAGSPQSPAYDAAAATQQADAEAITTADSKQTLSPAALKAMNSLFQEIKNAGTANTSAEIIKNVLNFVVNNGLRTLSLSVNMDEQSKKEIAALYKAGVNMHGLISQTQKNIADVTAARPAQVAGMAPATKTAPAAPAAAKPVAAKPATPSGTSKPRVVARRPAPAAPAASRTAE